MSRPADPAAWLPEGSRSAAKSWILVGLAWAVMSVANASQVYLSMLDHGHSYTRLVSHNFAIWGYWAGFTPLVARLARRHPLLPWQASSFFRHLAAALVLAAGHIAWWTEMTIRIRPYDAMTIVEFTPNFLGALLMKLNLELLIYGTIVGLAMAAETSRRLQQRELEASRLRAQLAGARLHALELQLKPHFLFNTLNTVTGLIRAGESAAAVEMIVRLSDLLHQTLATDPATVIPLARELELLRAYWGIEEERFADRLTLSLEVDPAALEALVPPLLLQPLAENAIRHGIAKVAGRVELRLKIERRGDTLAIALYNSGPPLGEVTPGVGLGNSRERLRQLYGDLARLELGDAPGGVLVELALPLQPPEPP